MPIQNYLTRKNLAIAGGVLALTTVSYLAGRSAGSKVETPKHVEVLKLEGYEIVREGQFLFGIDNDNNLRAVQAVEGQDPFALINEKDFNMDLKKTNETEKMNISGLEVKLSPAGVTRSVTIRKK